MTTKLKWRLGKLPSPDEVALLKKEGIITKEEAHEILFSQETEEDRDSKSLKEEIKFLRQLVQSLSSSKLIVENIYTYQKPYISQSWMQPYITYCSNINQLDLNSAGITYTNGDTGYTLNVAGTSSQMQQLANVATNIVVPPQDFCEIQTF